VFNGRFDHAIDEKGRVSIPARFRDVLEREGHDRMYITNFIFERERLLELYPPAEWERMVKKFADRKTGDRAAQLFETFYIGGAHEVQVDRQGRILIPPKLREFAGLGREVTFSARHNRFQLWDRATLDKILKSAEEQLLADPEFLAKIDF
jgi:transcriptional regulator MraZ